MTLKDQFDKLTELEKVISLISDLKVWRLGNWEGCCCSQFSVRGVNVDISCGKGREQAVWVSSNSKNLLRPVMAEVVKQVTEHSNRSGKWAEYFEEWSP